MVMLDIEAIHQETVEFVDVSQEEVLSEFDTKRNCFFLFLFQRQAKSKRRKVQEERKGRRGISGDLSRIHNKSKKGILEKWRIFYIANSVERFFGIQCPCIVDTVYALLHVWRGCLHILFFKSQKER